MPVADTLVESNDAIAQGRGTTHVDPVGAFVPMQSRAERTASFDLADFDVPKGREEEWRFTPVKKLAALLAEGSSGALDWTTELPQGVTTSTISLAEARGLGILPPQDRAAAVAAAGATEVLLVDIAPEAEPTDAVRLTLDGAGSEGAGPRARRGPRRAPLAGHGRRGPPRHGAAHRAGVGRHGRLLRPDCRGRPALGRRCDPPGPARRPRRTRRDLPPHLGHARWRDRPAQRQRPLCRAGRRCDAPRRVLRRLGPAPRAPVLRRPQHAALQEPRDLQGCAAGQDGPDRVGGRRPDPRRGRGHRHLRAEPQPHPHRWGTSRLGAQPRDRDRRDPGSRTRVRDRPLRRPAAVLPAGARHPRGGGQATRGSRLLRRRHP